MKKLAVITINYNTPAMTEKIIRHFQMSENDNLTSPNPLLETGIGKSGLDAEFIVIDNNSKDKVDPSVFSTMGVKLIYNNENYGFAKACNQGINNSDSEYILLLNSDVYITDGAISRMAAFMDENKNIGIIGPMMVFPDGRFQPSFGYYPALKSEFIRFSHLYNIIPGSTFTFDTKFNPVDKTRAQDVEWVTGGCMLIRREMLGEIGKLDEGYFLGVEDFDICYRARKFGWGVVYYPLAKVVHHHGYSSGGTRSVFRIEQDRNGLDYFLRKHHPEWKFTRLMIRLMHEVKIFIIKYLFK